MSDLTRFRSLSNRERAIVAIAVLLDGHDANLFLAADKDRGGALAKAAQDLAELQPELRMPLLGTLLRSAIEEMS